MLGVPSAYAGTSSTGTVGWAEDVALPEDRSHAWERLQALAAVEADDVDIPVDFVHTERAHRVDEQTSTVTPAQLRYGVQWIEDPGRRFVVDHGNPFGPLSFNRAREGIEVQGCSKCRSAHHHLGSFEPG